MNLKKILPVEDYVLLTTLSVEEVQRRLSENIEPERTNNPFTAKFSASKPYHGDFYGNSFEIKRVIEYKNSFLPIIKGTIEKFLGKTEIHIKMKMHSFIGIFMIVWLTIVVLIGGLSLFVTTRVPTTTKSPEMLRFVPLIMLVFGCLMPILAFKFESKKSKKFLADLLEAEEDQERS